ncbi:MAG: M6 family metalloprotease domain-containing protein [Bacteroidaceae bacterium]|nr:M6 family metalloprotease domain-containing protein [Bacteroidaceae bacterium]
MKRYILTLILTSFTLWLMAVPALRIRRSVTLDDGRTVMVTAYGNEDLDYLRTDDGEVIIERDNVFHATGLTVEEFLATLPQMPRYARRQVGSVATALVQPYGTKKIPVILTAFKDKQFEVARTGQMVNAFYDKFFNGADIYASTGNWGSVRQYFIDQSQGQFQPEFTIIGPVELDSVYSYYGKQSGGTKDLNYSEFVQKSFQKALALEEDWMQFDNNGDGKVDMCVIIFAGMGQNYTNSYGDKNTIWPQEVPATYTVGGITLMGCSSSCEMRPTAASNGVITGWQADGIGVVTHEISHAIGLPDFYDYNSVAFGLDFWSIMDYGMYTRQSKMPVGYTAYEREFMGWQQTEVIDGPRTLRLSCFGQGGKGYKIVNDANPNEYYILDNRQAVDWDWGLCSNRGHGMLVLHVDFNQAVWNNNRLNSNANHQYLTIIPANNSLIGSNNAKSSDEWKTSLLGNPYPGITENHELTNDSYPASLVYTGEYMNKPLYDIEETKDGIITVKVMPLGTLEAPKDLTVQDTEPGRTTAVWEPVEEAELYNLRLWCEGELVLQKDSLAATSYRFKNLMENINYSFSVQAISNSYRNSEWVESDFFLAIPDAVSEITESAERVRIYNMDGRMVGECFADELNRFSLRHGIYVVRRKDGRTKKIMIM